MRQYPEIDMETVRDYAQQQAERTTIRKLAVEIPLGHSTTYNFLTGTEPHPRVRRALIEWYMREKGLNGAAVVALDVLVGYLPPPAQPDARAALLETMAEGYRIADLPVPEWLERLRGA